MNSRYEDYGCVLRKRKTTKIRNDEAPQRQEQQQRQRPREKERRKYYSYNNQISLLVVPCFISLFFIHSNNRYGDGDNYGNNMSLLVTFLYCILSLYILDLTDCKDGFSVSIWISFVIIVIVLFLEWCNTSQESESFSFGSIIGSNKYYFDGGGEWMYWEMKLESCCIFLFSIWNLIAKMMFFFCLACWTTLQCQWLESNEAKYWEQMLHFNLPISFATIMSFTLLKFCQPHNDSSYDGSYDKINNFEWKEINFIWSMIPFVFTLLFSWSIKLLCNSKSSFSDNDQIIDSSILSVSSSHKNHNSDDLENTFTNNDCRQQQSRREQELRQNQQQMNDYYTIPSSFGCHLSYLVLGIPIVIHLLSNSVKRNNCQLLFMILLGATEQSTSMSTVQSMLLSWIVIVLDLLIIVLIPYLVHCFYLEQGLWWTRELFILGNQRNWVNMKTITITIGKTTLGMGSIFIIFTMTEVLIHRYLIQLCFIIAHHIHHDGESVVPSKIMISILLNCCIGVLVSAFWWVNSDRSRERRNDRNIRNDSDENVDELFFIMLLVSIICLGVALTLSWEVIFYTTSFALTFGLYIPTKKLRYMVLCLTVVLLSIRSINLKWFQLMDKSIWIIPGIMKLTLLQFHIIFSSGSFCCGIIYSLLRRHGMANNRFDELLEKNDSLGILLVAYNIFILLMEGVLLYEPLNTKGESLYSNLMVVITSFLLMGITYSLKWREAIRDGTYLLSLSLSIGKIVPSFIGNEFQNNEIYNIHWSFIASSIVAALFFYVVSWPFILMKPTHSSNGMSKEPSLWLPKSESKSISLFCYVILPLTIILCISLFKSLMRTSLDRKRQTYHLLSLLESEVMGYSMVIWGICVWSLLYYHFPNGNTEPWRSRALIGFISGLFFCFISPSISMFDTNDNAFSFAFASTSRTDYILQRNEKIGLWGLIVASIAILCMLHGPLNSRKNNSTGNRDNISFDCLMICSILFGCGLSWFLLFQLIEKFTKLQTVLVVLSSMVNSAICTVAVVYQIKQKDSNKVVMMGRKCMFISLISTSSTGIVLITSTDMAGQSISILLSFWAIYHLVLGASIRSRSHKDSKTCALANLCFLSSWLLLTILVYCCFGIASIGVSTSFNQILGIPASIVFTLSIAPILLLLEGKPKKKQKYGKAVTSKELTFFETRLYNLSDEQRYFLPFLAAGITFILVTIYVIFFRGLCNRLMTQGAHNAYEAIFQSTYGRISRTTHHSNIAELAKKHVSHHKMVTMTSKLAASGYWTSTSIVGPMIHFLGLIAVLHIWYSLASSALFSVRKVTHGTLLHSLLFNLFTVIFCRGIPSLTAAALLGGAMAIHKYITLRRNKSWLLQGV